jgi:hypothetical protein
MQLNGVRHAAILIALAVPLPLAGCGALGLGSAAPSPSAAATRPGNSWVIVQGGTVVASATPTRGTASPSATPGLHLGSAAPGCPADWSGDAVDIPLTVTVGTGSVTVTWPRQRDSSYRITAVPQNLVAGGQPAPVWTPVAAGSGCTVTSTIRGLTSGKPYIVWLDAPAAGFQLDGTANPRSGRSAVVYPR